MPFQPAETPQETTQNPEAYSAAAVTSLDFSTPADKAKPATTSREDDNRTLETLGLGAVVIAGLTTGDGSDDEKSEEKGKEKSSGDGKESAPELPPERRIPGTSDTPAEAPPVLDASERPSASNHLERIRERFAPLSPEDHQRSRAMVETELSQYKALDGKGSILDQLKDSTMSDAQKERVLDVMAEVRENYVSQQKDGKIVPEQRGSWLHGIGELGEALDVASRHNYTGAETQNSIFASLFSDSVKNGWNQASGGNFFTHHLDGALAAQEVLGRYTGDGLSQSDVFGISRAVLEHQISPPSFMGMVYGQEVVNGLNKDLQAEYETLKGTDPSERSPEQSQRLKELERNGQEYDRRTEKIRELETSHKLLGDLGESIPEEEAKTLQSLKQRQALGRFVGEAEVTAINNIRTHIGNPFNAPLEGTPETGMKVAFSPLEQSLLNKYVGEGTGNWHVPDKSTPWHKVSYALLAADSFDNYFGANDAEGKPVRGTFKIAALRGYNTPTRDLTLQSGIDGINQSARSAINLMDEIDRPYAEQRMKETEQVYDAAKERTGEWLREKLGLEPGAPLEKIPYWDTPVDGTNPEQVALANEMQQRFALELLKMRRFDGQEPADLKPVRTTSEAAAEPGERTTERPAERAAAERVESRSEARPERRVVNADEVVRSEVAETKTDGTRELADGKGAEAPSWRNRLTEAEIRGMDELRAELESRSKAAWRGEEAPLTEQQRKTLEALQEFNRNRHDPKVHESLIRQMGEARPEGGFKGREVAGRLIGLSIIASAALAIYVGFDGQEQDRPLRRARVK